ncbi:TPA: hypothetical protein ACX6Q2_003468 [Photobacterium damselae]
MTWNKFNIYGKDYDCSHLKTRDIFVDVDGIECKLTISYSHHCFTDKTENGPRLFRDGRCWSQERYEQSLELPSILVGALSSSNSYCVPHYHYNNEQFHYVEYGDYAIFFNINKPPKTTSELKIKVNSAYPLASWNIGLPKGKPKLIRWVLSQRIQGKKILK